MCGGVAMAVLEWAIISIGLKQYTQGMWVAIHSWTKTLMRAGRQRENEVYQNDYRGYQSNGISAVNFSAPPLLRLRLFSLACGFPTDPRCLLAL